MDETGERRTQAASRKKAGLKNCRIVNIATGAHCKKFKTIRRIMGFEHFPGVAENHDCAENTNKTMGFRDFLDAIGSAFLSLRGSNGTDIA